jgi:hypothetical protein
MMIFPESTLVNKRIPKAAFFANLHLNPGQRRALTAQLDSIHWRNKLAADILHISPGRDVLELQVFELRLAKDVEACTLLDVLDQQLPYHLLFLLLKGEQVKASIAYKKANQGSANAFTVLARFETDWMALDALRLPLEGLDMDAVYEGWVQEIAGARLPVKPGEGMAQALERMKKRQVLEKQIVALEKKAWSEKQPKKRFEMVQEIQKLYKEVNSCG